MSCPSTEELAALYDGVLSSKRASKIRQHLCQCAKCSREMKVLDELMGLGPAPQKPSESIMKKAMQLSKNTSMATTQHTAVKRKSKNTSINS